MHIRCPYAFVVVLKFDGEPLDMVLMMWKISWRNASEGWGHGTLGYGVLGAIDESSTLKKPLLLMTCS